MIERCSYGQEGLSKDDETIPKVVTCVELTKCKGGRRGEDNCLERAGLHFKTTTATDDVIAYTPDVMRDECLSSCGRQRLSD